jgi:hypothetical protein
MELDKLPHQCRNIQLGKCAVLSIPEDKTNPLGSQMLFQYGQIGRSRSSKTLLELDIGTGAAFL